MDEIEKAVLKWRYDECDAILLGI